MKKIKGILIDTYKGTITKETLECKSYKDICEMLNCEYATCVSRNINGNIVDIYCDDEALIKGIPLIPAIITTHKGGIREVIYNNCFLCSHNKEGELKSLTFKEIKSILSSIIRVSQNDVVYTCLHATL